MSMLGLKSSSRVNTELQQMSGSKTPQSPTATSTIIPGPNPGERLAAYFDRFFGTIVAISTLGASLTFSKVITSPVTPWIDYGYDEYTIQVLLGIAWLLFVIALVLTSLFASLLGLYRPQVIEAFATKDHYNKNRVMWAATGVSLLLYILTLASFIFLSLVIAAYIGPVGWTAMGITSSFGLIGIGGIIWQSPLGWPNWILTLLPRRGQDEPFPNRRLDSGLGFGGKPPVGTWPITRKDSYISRLRREAGRNAKSGTGGSNLTGGILPSSLRKKHSYPELFEDKDFAVDPAPPKMEDSFTSEKEWEFFRSAGGRTMRIQPRVSWPKDGVVSGQSSPPPPPQRYPPTPAQPRRGPREYKHDRRERMQQMQQYTQLPQPVQETHDSQAQQRYSSYSHTSTMNNDDEEYEHVEDVEDPRLDAHGGLQQYA